MRNSSKRNEEECNILLKKKDSQIVLGLVIWLIENSKNWYKTLQYVEVFKTFKTVSFHSH